MKVVAISVRAREEFKRINPQPESWRRKRMDLASVGGAIVALIILTLAFLVRKKLMEKKKGSGV